MTVSGNATNNRQKHSHIFTVYILTTINLGKIIDTNF